MTDNVAQLTLDRVTGKGRYCDVLDVCELFGDRYGSPTNALNVLCRHSELFHHGMKLLGRDVPNNGMQRVEVPQTASFQKGKPA